jgi:amidase
MSLPKESWQERATKKITETKSKIPNTWLLPDKELDLAKQRRNLTGPDTKNSLPVEVRNIIELDTLVLAEKISTGFYTAYQVTQAYCMAAALALQVVRPLVLFDLCSLTLIE